ncbi:hypothetical protein AK812_SmicGene43382 [Symbiodinium microadriaticum]|uniref:Uncharacterized protein n=1 Tax=Symbiodinium microadriaticum TaxID=2951 RepID=A0A1Q9C162_SYMMI|nr:hypothetical protein AK812_SmicGene43382 [Symbiodinium microadriaticum]
MPSTSLFQGSPHGGARICLPQLIPAEVPKFEDFDSYLASSLTITWSRGVYLSQTDSPCKFRQWLVEDSLPQGLRLQGIKIGQPTRLFAAGNNDGGFLREEEGQPDGASPTPASFDELESTRLTAVSGGRDHIVAVTNAGLRDTAASDFAALYTWTAAYSLAATLSLQWSDTAPAARFGGSALARPLGGSERGGESSSLALLSSGEIYAWGILDYPGSNDLGQLGVGDTEPRSVAVQSEYPSVASRPASNTAWRFHEVPDLPIAKHVSGGGAAATATANWASRGVPWSSDTSSARCLTFDGTVVGFGSNSEGQLGIGRISDCEERPVPAMLRQGADTKKLLVFALAEVPEYREPPGPSKAVTMDHSCVLALPAPERRDQLDRYMSEGRGSWEDSDVLEDTPCSLNPDMNLWQKSQTGRWVASAGSAFAAVAWADVLEDSRQILHSVFFHPGSRTALLGAMVLLAGVAGAEAGEAESETLKQAVMVRRSQPIPPIQEDDEAREAQWS